MTDRSIRRIAALLTAVCLILSLLFCFPLTASAAGDLDVIENYEITVTPRDDATLDMTCHVVWRVLDSTKEGPLTWVKIGLPNVMIENLVTTSDCISRIETDGSYARIDFDRAYVAGETVDFTFSWHQSYMFHVNDDGTLVFDYTPGWFDEIIVERAAVTWNADGMTKYKSGHGVVTQEGSLLTLSGTHLSHGEKLNMTVTYPASRFPAADLEQTADNVPEESVLMPLILLVTVIAAVTGIASYVDYRKYKDKDYWTGGFEEAPFAGSAGYVHVPFFGNRYVRRRALGAAQHLAPTKPKPQSSGSSGHGSGCACACACACAGGGRAGCSRKNVYGTDASALEPLLHEGGAQTE